MKKLIALVVVLFIISIATEKKYYYLEVRYNDVYVTDGKEKILIDTNVDPKVLVKLESQIGYKSFDSAVYHYNLVK